MKKLHLLLAFIMISSIGYSITKQSLNWKKGEIKHIRTKMISKDSDKDNSTIILSSNKLEVLESTKENYKIRIAITSYSANNFGKGKLGEYKVNKKDFSIKLLNGREWSKNLEKSYQELIEKADTEQKAIADSIKEKLYILFVELNFKKQKPSIGPLDFILEAYRIKYSKEKAIHKTDSISFPISKDLTVSLAGNKKRVKRPLQERIPTEIKIYVQELQEGNYNVIKETKAFYEYDYGKALKKQADAYGKKNIIGGEILQQGIFKLNFSVFKNFIIEKNDNNNWPIYIRKEEKVNSSTSNAVLIATVNID